MLTDQELLLRLRNFEDHFVERKSSGDKKKDWLKTVVAFANSVPVGYPAVLFIGVKNDGTIKGTANLDSLQKTFTDEINEAYPPIYYLPRVVESGGKQCLAVIVPGSPNRPHFAGQSYVRKGSKTEKASEKEFDEFIAQRQSKTYEILKWKDKPVTYALLYIGRARVEPKASGECMIADCNQFYVTIRPGTAGSADSYPLSRVELSFDHHKSRLKLEIGYY